MWLQDLQNQAQAIMKMSCRDLHASYFTNIGAYRLASSQFVCDSVKMLHTDWKLGWGNVISHSSEIPLGLFCGFKHTDTYMVRWHQELLKCFKEWTDLFYHLNCRTCIASPMKCHTLWSFVWSKCWGQLHPLQHKHFNTNRNKLEFLNLLGALVWGY